jgi:hypothetical protein
VPGRRVRALLPGAAAEYYRSVAARIHQCLSSQYHKGYGITYGHARLSPAHWALQQKHRRSQGLAAAAE